MGRIIGIDLGTTNSYIAVLEGGESKVIPNSEGYMTAPSVVAFIEGDECKVGDPVRRQAIVNPTNMIYSIRHFMGETYDQIQKEAKCAPFKVVKGDNDTPRIDIDGRLYTPQEILAMILQKMKETAEDYFGIEVTGTVVTVPAYFNDSQRQATKKAGEIAGFKVRCIVNEPTTALLACGPDKKSSDMKIAAFDLGGSTFNISILELGDGVSKVRSTNGDTHLDGDDFNHVIINWPAEELMKDEDVDPCKDNMALQRLKNAAEHVKIELSSSISTETNLPYLIPIDGIAKYLVRTLTRAKFEQLVDKLTHTCVEPRNQALKGAGLMASDINEVILASDSTRIPAIQEIVKKTLNQEPSKGVNPGEVVVRGAAIRGTVLTGGIKDVLLLDVTPLSLGLEMMGGVMIRLIDANTTIPTKKSQIFTTVVNNQPSVEIRVLQGECLLAEDNKSIGRFTLDDIVPALRWVPQTKVTFDIDADGILNATAVDKATDRQQNVHIEASSGLSDSEIRRMKQEVETDAKADEGVKTRIDKLNQADSIILSTEKQLKELGDRIPADKKAPIEAALGGLRKARKTEDIPAIDKAMGELNTAFHAVTEQMYNQVNAQQQAGPQPGASVRPNDNAFAKGNDSSDVADVDLGKVK